jgi:hypothetical protein
VNISVSASSYTVSQLSGSENHVLAQGEIPVATSHRAEVAISSGRVTVDIDGQQVSSTPLVSTGTHGPAGGIQITSYRHSAESPVPRVHNLSVR